MKTKNDIRVLKAFAKVADQRADAAVREYYKLLRLADKAWDAVNRARLRKDHHS